jgi:hypothetical protein
MPSEKYQALIRVGPFKGYDATAADEYIDPADASSGSINVDTHRVLAAMMVQRGRVPIEVSGIPTTSPITFVTSFTPKEDQRFVVFCAPYYEPASSIYYITGVYNTQTATLASLQYTASFNSAAQYGTALYLNNGTQIRDGSIYIWQQPPTAYLIGTDINCVSTTPSGSYVALAQGIYFYTLTRTVTYADGTTQETSPDSLLTLPGNYGENTIDGEFIYRDYVLAGVSTTSAPTYSVINLLAGHTWSGTNADGSTYKTNIYRLSTNQPTWFLIASGLTGNAAYSDDVADGAIASNAQLDLNHDPPPFTTTVSNAVATGVVFQHVERLFCFLVVNNADTLNQPQIQLWWSDYGLPWSFNKADSVTLVGNSGVPNPPSSVLPRYFGDLPVAAVSLASCAVLFKQRTFWLLFGNDPATFIVIKAADIGCVSQQSVCNCQGVVFWLSEEGVYQFDGNTPLYIGEKVRGFIEQIPVADQQNAVGFFADRTYWLSFPASNVTLGYYLPSQEWISPLPYACLSAVSVPSESAPPTDANGKAITPRHNYVVASRTTTPALDAWFARDGDLGNPATAVWQTGVESSQTPWIEKSYHYICVEAPVQVNTAEIKLDVLGFGGTVTTNITVDLSKGPSQIIPIPQANARGFSAQLYVSIQSTATTTPPVIYSVTVAGTQERAWLQQS